MGKSLNFKDIVARTGKWTLLVVIVLIALNYWNVINLSGIPIPRFESYLYVYLLLNGVAASPYIIWERRARVRSAKICPQCDKLLESTPVYKCPECGTIQFEKDNQ